MEDEVVARNERTYRKCEELHGLAIYFEKRGKHEDALYVCKQILLEPAAYEQPEKELPIFVFQMCDFLCKTLGDEPQRRYFKKCENEYYKQILLAKNDYNKAECDKILKKTEDCRMLARICEQENPELAILYLLKHREGITEQEKEEFNEQLQRLMSRTGANRYEENFRQHLTAENLANIENANKDGNGLTRAPKILRRPGLKKENLRRVEFKLPEVTYSQEKFRRRMIKLALIGTWAVFVWFAMHALRNKLEENGVLYMLNKIRAIIIALGVLAITNVQLPTSTEVIPQRKEKAS